MSDELTDRMSRLPSALPPVRWAPAAELRRIGRNRRRRRAAAVALGVLLAVVAGTGVGYGLVASTAAPVQPSTSDTPTIPPTQTPTPTPSWTPPVEAAGQVPASVMLADSDLPAGYRLTDQVATTTGVQSPNPYRSFEPTCTAYAELTIESVAGSNAFRWHSYYVGQDLSTSRIDETVVRFGSAEAVISARARILRLVHSCLDPAADSGAVFSFVMSGADPAGQPATQYWTVIVAPQSRLLAIVRTPSRIDGIGEAALARLES